MKTPAYKRPYDVSIVLVFGLLLLPVWVSICLLVAAAIWLHDRGPVFYTQDRLGRGGKVYRILKFRTMVCDAERETGPVWAKPDDPRVTAVGRILRPLQLDELPQLVNVLRGEMSLVGPRPERPELAKRFERRVPGYSRRLRVLPGLAGLAHVRGSYWTPPRDRLRYDEFYMERMDPWLDTKIILSECVRLGRTCLAVGKDVLHTGRKATDSHDSAPGQTENSSMKNSIETTSTRPKIFQIGFNRCGTTSIHRLFQAGGLRSVHHDYGRLALMMDDNLRNNRHILTGYEDFDAYSDMEFLMPPLHIEAFKFYEEILRQVPDALFILNVRDVEGWVASRMGLEMDRKLWVEREVMSLNPSVGLPQFQRTRRYRRASYAEFYREAYGLADLGAVADCWRADWDQHIGTVKQVIPAERLLVFDIEKDSPVSLCRFVGLNEGAALHYGRHNGSLGTVGQFLAFWTPDVVLSGTPRLVKRAARRVLRKRP